MQERVSLPFLHQDISLEKLGHGFFNEVWSVNVPESLRSPEASDMVLKELTTDLDTLGIIFDSDQRFKGLTEEDFDAKLIGFSLSEIVATLRHREQFVDQIFKNHLPDLVVPTHFVLGNNEHGDPRVYSFQKKQKASVINFRDIFGFFDGNVVKTNQALEQIAKQLKVHFEPTQLEAVKNQLLLFIEGVQEMCCQDQDPQIQRSCVDFFGENNLILTEAGDLRLIDTNIFMDITDPILKDDVHRDIRRLQNLVKLL